MQGACRAPELSVRQPSLNGPKSIVISRNGEYSADNQEANWTSQADLVDFLLGRRTILELVERGVWYEYTAIDCDATPQNWRRVLLVGDLVLADTVCGHGAHSITRLGGHLWARTQSSTESVEAIEVGF